MARKYYEATTPRWQRYAIWIIAVVMAGGTLLAFFLPMIFASNPEADPNQIAADRLQQDQAKLDALTSEHQAKVDARNQELTEKYFAELDGYKARVGAFDAAAITELATDDIKVGDGAEITDDNRDYSMYYIGWAPDGKIFDSSFDGDKLKSPLAGDGNYIEGWNEGVIGMKVGGAREISIPAAKAYGEAGSGEAGSDNYIAPNTPLKFVVMAVAHEAEIPYPKGTMAACEKAMATQAAQYGATAAQLCQMYGYDNEEN
jgi:FKBP-type peptidyl-prolyl cis-trans isomerase